MKNRYLLLLLACLIPAGMLYAQSKTPVDIDEPLKHQFTTFRMGDVQFKVPDYYLEGTGRPETYPKEWEAQERMGSAKFRNVFDGKCYKKCGTVQYSSGGNISMLLNDLSSKNAVDKMVVEQNKDKEKYCHNPNSPYFYRTKVDKIMQEISPNTVGSLCDIAFNYHNLLVTVNFRTADYPVESIPELIKQSKIFLDRFVQSPSTSIKGK